VLDNERGTKECCKEERKPPRMQMEEKAGKGEKKQEFERLSGKKKNRTSVKDGRRENLVHKNKMGSSTNR